MTRSLDSPRSVARCLSSSNATWLVERYLARRRLLVGQAQVFYLLHDMRLFLSLIRLRNQRRLFDNMRTALCRFLGEYELSDLAVLPSGPLLRQLGLFVCKLSSAC